MILYTFGEPRTGNPAFATKFEQLVGGATAQGVVHRVVNKHDVVTHIPPRDAVGTGSYHHIAQEVWLAPNGPLPSAGGAGGGAGCARARARTAALRVTSHRLPRRGAQGLGPGPRRCKAKAWDRAAC